MSEQHRKIGVTNPGYFKEEPSPMGGTTFEEAESYLYSSESVTEGHPDKICDQISDGILDAIYEQDPQARVACETATTTNLVVIIGEITTTAKVDYEAVARATLRDIGYSNAATGIDWETCEIIVRIHEQSPNINAAVSTALEHRNSPPSLADTEVSALGAGDQGMMVGFACNETAELMPLTISLSHRLTKRLAIVRKEGAIPYLGPDGKSQVTIEYEFGKPKRIHTVIISTQHEEGVPTDRIEKDIKDQVIDPVMPADLYDETTRVLVNPSGKFVIGGPYGDAGLTGRKILVDTYGGVARHGGGAFSGKDPTKVDRSGAYAARYVAKNIVAAGLADRCEVQISYAIGVAQPISVSIETFGTNRIPDSRIVELIHSHFDLRPGAIIKDLNLRRPIYQQTASYGHFGRVDVDLPWERTDKSDALQAALPNE
jgi:S-adenosylmethionine synthetase